MRQVVNAITGVLIIFGAIALIAASFGVINTFYICQFVIGPEKLV